MKNKLKPLELHEIADTHHCQSQTYGFVAEIVSFIALGLCGGAIYHKLLADHYANRSIESVDANSKN